MFALPKSEHFERKNICAVWNYFDKSYKKQYNIWSPISIDLNICKFGKLDRKRASFVGLQVKKCKKSQLDR